MDRLPPAPARAAAPGRATERSATLAAVEDLQTAAADLGWPEATGLADALVDALAHLLVDLSDGVGTPREQPLVVGAIGGPSRPPDHASCRAAAASLRRISPVLLEGAAAWSSEAGRVALDLADTLDQVADRSRGDRLPMSYKGVVLRRLHALQRRLRALG